MDNDELKKLEFLIQFQIKDSKPSEPPKKTVGKKKFCVRCGAKKSIYNNHPRLCSPCLERKLLRLNETWKKLYKGYKERGLSDKTCAYLASPYEVRRPIGQGREVYGVIKIMLQEYGRYIT